MMFDKVNIQEVLTSERQQLEESRRILAEAARKDEELLARMAAGDNNDDKIILPADDAERIYTIAEIRKVCINYRLRFLDTKYYRLNFPYEALARINEFEKLHGKIRRFRIIAPSKAFELEDCNQDPLLFADLGNDRYYLLHKWGNDIAWYRKLLYFPLRNVFTYFYSVLAIATLLAWITPFDWFNVAEDNIIYMRMWFSIHCFIGLFFFCIFLGATMQTGFSSMNWKSKFMNE